jgi:hypothetical protein
LPPASTETIPPPDSDFPKTAAARALHPEPPQNGDCYQFPPLELDSCPRFALNATPT